MRIRAFIDKPIDFKQITLGSQTEIVFDLSGWKIRFFFDYLVSPKINFLKSSEFLFVLIFYEQRYHDSYNYNTI